MERFNLNELNEVKGKEQYKVTSQTGSQLWEISVTTWTLINLGEMLDRVS
jgi:hypothetical protein